MDNKRSAVQNYYDPSVRRVLKSSRLVQSYGQYCDENLCYEHGRLLWEAEGKNRMAWQAEQFDRAEMTGTRRVLNLPSRFWVCVQYYNDVNQVAGTGRIFPNKVNTFVL